MKITTRQTVLWGGICAAMLAVLAIDTWLTINHRITSPVSEAILHWLWAVAFVVTMWLATHRRVLAVMLIASVLALSAQAQTNAPFKLLSTQEIKPNFTACEFAIGGVVIIVGGVMIWKICTSPFWTNIPTPPPPATNPPTPPRTNNHPRAALCAVFELAAMPTSDIPLFAVSLSNSVVADEWGGGTFDTYHWGKYPWQSSRDLIQWKDCEIRVWANSKGCLSEILDGDGLRLATNYTARDSDWQAHYYVPPVSNVLQTTSIKFFRARYD